MDSGQLANIAYLGLLAIAITGSYVVSNRDQMGKMAQQAMIWLLIFVGVVAAFGLWNDIQRDVTGHQIIAENGIIEVPRRADGHYYLTLELNGTMVEFVVDTGASQMVLTQNDARRIGLDPANLRYTGRANTANGEVSTAAVMLNSVRLGDITDANVRAVVNGGPMEGSLLGMSYLRLYRSIEITGGHLLLTR